MSEYKKRGLISILTMVMVIGLLSTAFAITTDGNHRRYSRDGDGQQHSGHSGEVNNRRADMNNLKGVVNNDNRGKHARTGRGKTTPVKIPTSTSVTAAPTDNPENTDADHHRYGKDVEISQLRGHGDEENNHHAYINNLNGYKNSNNRDSHVRSETTPVKTPASTSDTAAPTDS